jgi:hypothetical protein
VGAARSARRVALDPAWRTLEVIEHTEETIHRVERRRQPGAAPPKLRVERKTAREVVLTYDSPRKLLLPLAIVAPLAGASEKIGGRRGDKKKRRGVACAERSRSIATILSSFSYSPRLPTKKTAVS